MKYFVITDPHAFFPAMREALKEAGYFSETGPRRLVLGGDLLDRGKHARAIVDFMLNEAREGRLIYVLGNHEDLLVRCLQDIAHGAVCDIALGDYRRYVSNGTWDTVLQLAELKQREAMDLPEELVRAVRASPFYRELLPLAVNFHETKKHVFCHGWIPVLLDENDRFCYREDWREADYECWKRARWLNGMELACRYSVTVAGKTVVCGHFHTSYGHSVIEKKGSEWEADADFSPFRAEGILALDACVAYSGIINCAVIEDEEV